MCIYVGFQIWMPENQLCGALNAMKPHPLNCLNFKSWHSSWDMKFPFEVDYIVSELDLIIDGNPKSEYHYCFADV